MMLNDTGKNDDSIDQDGWNCLWKVHSPLKDVYQPELGYKERCSLALAKELIMDICRNEDKDMAKRFTMLL
ncbi:hypothetical protein TSUD_341050 [Trifolium subterraneum]|uniref:Uncharacterized protein n=1 Tax=Trifolium subterraneum TaxID=3900 RepID=A0A2Z6LYZ7_TRISU|nr:hypothetical protein TSUD_341050 [Trifolium subterraneum]